MRRGQAAVEFVVISILLFTFLFGIIDWGIYFWRQASLNSAVTDATRIGITWDWNAGHWYPMMNDLKSLVLSRAQSSLGGQINDPDLANYLNIDIDGNPLALRIELNNYPYRGVVRIYSRVPEYHNARSVMTVVPR